MSLRTGLSDYEAQPCDGVGRIEAEAFVERTEDLYGKQHLNDAHETGSFRQSQPPTPTTAQNILRDQNQQVCLLLRMGCDLSRDL